MDCSKHPFGGPDVFRRCPCPGMATASATLVDAATEQCLKFTRQMSPAVGLLQDPGSTWCIIGYAYHLNPVSVFYLDCGSYC